MKFKMFIIVNLFLAGALLDPAFALEHSQKNGLFSMNIPKEWHWFENPQEIIITYPDGKTLAIDIQFVPSRKLSLSDIKNTIKQANDKMIKEGVEGHHGILIDNREISLNALYATRLDFKTSPPNPMLVTYISFFTKGYAVTVTYGSEDAKMHAVMDDVFETINIK